MGYFAGRAAPLGDASLELVAATFFNLHPAMVARALPDAWQIATPTEIVDARSRVWRLKRFSPSSRGEPARGRRADRGPHLARAHRRR